VRLIRPEHNHDRSPILGVNTEEQARHNNDQSVQNTDHDKTKAKQ
jgi:hypothetical protein